MKYPVPKRPKSDEVNLRYVAFSYEDFFNDVEFESNEVIGAYMRFLRLYTRRHCDGLPDDNLALRQMSGCMEREDVPDQWLEVRERIFGWPIDPKCSDDELERLSERSFFKLLEDGRYHQKRARQEFLAAEEKVKKDRELNRQRQERYRRNG